MEIGVLVVCDYATWYPEAITMHGVEAEQVAEELVTLFVRVGSHGDPDGTEH